MKKRILTIMLASMLLLGMTSTSIQMVGADSVSNEKQLYHLAIENQLFGSYNWGGTGVEMPENSMAAANNWAPKTIASFWNGGGWSASGNVVRVRNTVQVTALGDVYMDSTLVDTGRDESRFPRKVQLWKINNIANVANESTIITATAVPANWEKVAEVTIVPDKPGALSTGKGFNWTNLETPVVLVPGQVYVVVVEQGAGAAYGIWGNPRPNEINNVLAMHPDNIAEGIPQIASDKDFYVSGGLIGTFGDNLVNVQNALTGSMYSGGNFKYKTIAKEILSAPATSATTTNSATITWTAASDSTAFGTVGGYEILLSEADSEPVTIYVNGKNTTTFNLTDLLPNTTYTVKISAVTQTGGTGTTVATYQNKIFTTAGSGVTPTATSAASSETNSSSNANTGDGGNNPIIIMLFMLSAIGITIGIKRRRTQIEKI